MDSDRDTLADYVLDICERHNLTMRQASIRSGLDPSTIAKIVRRGKHGGAASPATLQAIADALGADFRRMMVLAGHLDQPLEAGPDDGDLVYDILRIQEVWRKLRHVDPDAARRLAEHTLAVSNTMLDAIGKENLEEAQEPRKEE